MENYSTPWWLYQFNRVDHITRQGGPNRIWPIGVVGQPVGQLVPLFHYGGPYNPTGGLYNPTVGPYNPTSGPYNPQRGPTSPMVRIVLATLICILI